MARVDAFLQLGREQGCSDVHLAVGMPPLLRRNGELFPVKYRQLTEAELTGMLAEVLTEAQWVMCKSGVDVDFAYDTDQLGRFRVNLFRKMYGLGATFRVVPHSIPTLDSLGLPPVVQQLAQLHQGLVLVTGTTGSGKSTTLAAMVQLLNSTRKLNIITLEDPIEFVHTSQQSLIVQRQIGEHVGSFAEGLRAALREDPDVILVGELRDAETVSMALMAAETGHLVLSTMHTTSASKTLDRLLDIAPGDQKAQLQTTLSQTLRGVIAQTLVRTADGQKRRVITEIMVMTPAIAQLLLMDQIFQIPMKLQTGRSQGMHLMDQALLEAVQRKEIDPNDAYRVAQDKRSFQRLVTDPNLLPKVSLVGG